MIKVGIIGGAGYTAGELLRLLIFHPEVSIEFVHSSSNSGRHLYEIHEGLIGDTDLVFSDTHPLDSIDVLFLCSAHGQSKSFWEENKRPDNLKVIDLAQDFRDETNGYVYGLPEFNIDRIAGALSIANPGCFATAIQLSLLPLASANLLPNEVNVVAITGSTGAGVKPGATTHFSWRNNNLSVYKPFSHQHLKEIKASIGKLQPGNDTRINFIPMRGDFARGIFATTLVDSQLSSQDATVLFKTFYKDAPFTIVSDEPIDLKQVVNTNKAILHLDTNDGKLLVTCAIDNLLKGASGQAVQNMNIMFGLPQSLGLHLKPSAF